MEKQRLIDYWRNSGIIKDEKLFKVFKEIARELFIRNENIGQVYGDHPLPIGYEQTISQPTTVMIMTQALELEEGQKVLEVGTGSGWQAAIIGKYIGPRGKVITTEIVPELADFANNNLKKAKIKNVEVIHYDGSQGYEKEAPYDRCIITAACPKIPRPIIDQLKENGIIIAPVGSLFFGQDMIKLGKTKSGITTESLGSFIFVPLKGKHGYK